MKKSDRWVESYLLSTPTSRTFEEWLTMITRGDFARGQRTLERDTVKLGSYA